MVTVSKWRRDLKKCLQQGTEVSAYETEVVFVICVTIQKGFPGCTRDKCAPKLNTKF